MPAKSGRLGFNCKCGNDHGSWRVVNPKNQHKNEKNKNDSRRIFGRAEPDRIQIPKRSELKPVEHAWKNNIESKLELERLTHRINEIKSLLSNESLFPEGRKKLQEEIELFGSKIESEIRKRKQEDLKNAEWDVTEEIVDESGNKVTRTWNPIKLIREYREVGDLFLHVNPPFDFFFNKVLVKHSYAIREYMHGEHKPEERKSRMLKGFELICKYREPFYDKNWRYTWPEWHVIVKYAEAESSRKAAKMLRALDGEEGIMSRRYIERQKKRVSSFFKDFYEYIPYFVDFYIAILYIIENDPELKEEYEKILKEKAISSENYEEKIKQGYINSLSQPRQSSNQIQCITGSNKGDVKLPQNVRMLDNGILEVGLERIKVDHSNPNYKEETEEFEKLSKLDRERLRGEKKQPRKKTTCIFSPFELPVDKIEKLQAEGKVLPW
jgi:hypothetical protein